MSKENDPGTEQASEFALRLAAQQQEARDAAGVDDGVDKDRATAFLNRALSASLKYQKEYQKSQRKLDALHDSLQADHGLHGTQQVQQAMAEHASEVFTPQPQVELN
ncbi:hypothetical protein AB1Y20_002996 [Prymnesium parvum]|uniref:Tubulin-specific chaperone A n=1 Tax=Prymnesium parvum TaxID=97485 RepID=A0AB34JDD7_PRYPA|mmetsp:Transcript_26618/g.64212  ORF Transcript_26618/g.64212 Transcript_26618/m.64212 type:complete len:107 (-) Transcript_26618:129-449(-)